MSIPLEKKIVTTIPLQALWTCAEDLHATRGRSLNAASISSLLHSWAVEFAVADCGKPLKWVSGNDTFSFWKAEAKLRIVESTDGKIVPDEYPGGYCYVASEWTEDQAERVIILLEKYH